MKRHNARIISVISLYSMDIKKLSSEEGLNNFLNICETFDEEEYGAPYDKEYAKKCVEGVINNLTKIDEYISTSLVGYTLDRLSYVDRAIIRLCVYEIFFGNTPKEIAVNEAIEITKEYSSIDEKQAKFNNRVLDNIINNYYGR